MAMTILSDLVSGGFTILATFLGFVLGLVSGVITWLWKARGISDMLADEVKVNSDEYEKQWAPGMGWPVRSTYIWQSLQPLVPGVLSRARVQALMTFYYRQATIYKERDQGTAFEQRHLNELRDAARTALNALGR